MLRSVIAAAALTVAGLAAPTAAQAAAPIQASTTACSLADIGITGKGSCVGWEQGNLLGNSPAMNASTASALNALLGVNTFTATNLTTVQKLGSLSGSTIDFTKPLIGTTVLGIHVGAAKGATNGIGYQGTAFYVFDAGTTGIDKLTFNIAGLSNATLFSTGTASAVPEPATWAMMMLGLGAVGFGLRRRRSPASRALAA